MHDVEYAMNFIEDVQAKTSVDAVLALFSDTIRRCGLTSYLIVDVPEPAETLDRTVLAFGAPDAWFQSYLDADAIRHDPTVAALRQSGKPFLWSEAIGNDPESANSRQFLDVAARHGLRDGFSVPVFDVGGKLSAVTMAGAAVTLLERDRGALHLIAIYAHARLRELLEKQGVKPLPVTLSPRETECLRWTAAGKSSREISELLKISVHTVDGYLNSLSRKLEVTNRAHAVAEAFRRGFLN